MLSRSWSDIEASTRNSLWLRRGFVFAAYSAKVVFTIKDKASIALQNDAARPTLLGIDAISNASSRKHRTEDF